MKNWLVCFLSLGFLGLIPNVALGQISKRDLTGFWVANNRDSLFYKSDSITFYQGDNIFSTSENCSVLTWDIERNDLTTRLSDICEEPKMVANFLGSEKIKIHKTDYGQVLTWISNKKEIDRFKVLNLKKTSTDSEKDEITSLSLLRFDKLRDEELLKHVDSLIYRVLNYKPDEERESPDPLIILNGVVLPDKKLLTYFRLVELIDISVLNSNQVSELFPHRLTNGIILITVSEKRFQDALKK